MPRFSSILLIGFLVLITSSCYGGYGDAAARTRADDASASRAGSSSSSGGASSSKSTGASSSGGAHHHHGKEAEPVIEEVNAKQLERLLNEKDFVAVYWCKF